jgi:hypothetical protein
LTFGKWRIDIFAKSGIRTGRYFLKMRMLVLYHVLTSQLPLPDVGVASLPLDEASPLPHEEPEA